MSRSAALAVAHDAVICVRQCISDQIDIIPYVKTFEDWDKIWYELTGTTNSVVAEEDCGHPVDLLPEGIIARTVPLLRFRNGDRLMFKWKISDLAEMES